MFKKTENVTIIMTSVLNVIHKTLNSSGNIECIGAIVLGNNIWNYS